MNFKTPAECGISSANIEKFIRDLEDKHLFTHNVLLAKGDDVFFEKYWAPFDEKFIHRQYSVTKSITALAVGFAVQDGLVDLDAPISRYFPEEAAAAKCELLKKQTVREMLSMRTSLVPEKWLFHWKSGKHTDRVQFYFENSTVDNKRNSGTIYNYDSSGSFVLCAMVEKVTGMSLIEYMRKKCFDKIGVSPEADCLICPGGYSWADSGLLCTARDLYLMARFTMNMGKWNGEQLLNEDFVRAATSKLTDNNPNLIYEFNTFGYGYLIWRTYDNSFFFNGMGGQLAVCVPDKDIILIYNADNQNNNLVSKKNVIDSFFKHIIRAEQNTENEAQDAASLAEYTRDLKLGTVVGANSSPMAEKISGKTFRLDPNPMHIKWIRITFTGDEGRLDYENATGEKSITFGMGDNVFGIFPEEGYSDRVGGVRVPGNFYKTANGAAWVEDGKLGIAVQAIDKYMGRLHIQLGFKDENTVGIKMSPFAEYFFEEYDGYAAGYAE